MTVQEIHFALMKKAVAATNVSIVILMTIAENQTGIAIVTVPLATVSAGRQRALPTRIAPLRVISATWANAILPMAATQIPFHLSKFVCEGFCPFFVIHCR